MRLISNHELMMVSGGGFGDYDGDDIVNVGAVKGGLDSFQNSIGGALIGAAALLGAAYLAYLGTRPADTKTVTTTKTCTTDPKTYDETCTTTTTTSTTKKTD